MSNARVVSMSNAEYHADSTAISHSGLDDLMNDPKDFYQRRVLKLYDREPSEAMAFGTRLHNCILAPGSFGAGAVVAPSEVLSANGSRAGAKYKAFAAEHAGKEIIKAGEPLSQMIEAGCNDEMIRLLIEADGDYEHTIVWHDDQFDVDRKARLDMLHLDREVIVDLKTTSKGMTPKALATTIYNFGYHRQAAYYIDAVREMYGVERPKFVLVFFSTNRPYNVATHDLTDDYIELGREENEAGLKKYAECLRTGLWLPDTHGRIITLSPPGFARWDKEWRVTT